MVSSPPIPVSVFATAGRVDFLEALNPLSSEIKLRVNLRPFSRVGVLFAALDFVFEKSFDEVGQRSVFGLGKELGFLD
jgi:hypothetical protein